MPQSHRYTDPTGLHPRAGQGVSNDQTATHAGRARLRLAELLPPGSTITALPITRGRPQSDYPVSEYYLLTIHQGAITLLDRELRAIGFGVNRQRGTIRTIEPLTRVIAQIGYRVYGDPNTYEFTQLDTGLSR